MTTVRIIFLINIRIHFHSLQADPDFMLVYLLRLNGRYLGFIVDSFALLQTLTFNALFFIGKVLIIGRRFIAEFTIKLKMSFKVNTHRLLLFLFAITFD